MSHSKDKHKIDEKARKEMLELDMTFGHYEEVIDNKVEREKTTNIFSNYLKQNIWVFLFVIGVLIATLFVMGFETQHPVVCSSTGIVKEIISIDKEYAQIKLEDNQLINYPISYVNQSRGGNTRVYNAMIKPEDKICLAYTRQ